AGRPPFRGETTLETLEQVRTAEPVPLNKIVPSIPRDLETICLKCLEKEQQKRYRTAEDLAEDLRRFLCDEPIQARRSGGVTKSLKWFQRNRLVASLFVAISMLRVALVFIVLHLMKPDPNDGRKPVVINNDGTPGGPTTEQDPGIKKPIQPPEGKP